MSSRKKEIHDTEEDHPKTHRKGHDDLVDDVSDLPAAKTKKHKVNHGRTTPNPVTPAVSTIIEEVTEETSKRKSNHEDKKTISHDDKKPLVDSDKKSHSIVDGDKKPNHIADGDKKPNHIVDGDKKPNSITDGDKKSHVGDTKPHTEIDKKPKTDDKSSDGDKRKSDEIINMEVEHPSAFSDRVTTPKPGPTTQGKNGTGPAFMAEFSDEEKHALSLLSPSKIGTYWLNMVQTTVAAEITDKLNAELHKMAPATMALPQSAPLPSPLLTSYDPVEILRLAKCTKQMTDWHNLILEIRTPKPDNRNMTVLLSSLRKELDEKCDWYDRRVRETMKQTLEKAESHFQRTNGKKPLAFNRFKGPVKQRPDLNHEPLTDGTNTWNGNSVAHTGSLSHPTRAIPKPPITVSKIPIKRSSIADLRKPSPARPAFSLFSPV